MPVQTKNRDLPGMISPSTVRSTAALSCCACCLLSVHQGPCQVTMDSTMVRTKILRKLVLVVALPMRRRRVWILRSVAASRVEMFTWRAVSCWTPRSLTFRTRGPTAVMKRVAARLAAAVVANTSPFLRLCTKPKALSRAQVAL